MHMTPLPVGTAPAEAHRILQPFLLQCVNWSIDAPALDAAALEADDQLCAYISGWGRRGDIAVLAHSADLSANTSAAPHVAADAGADAASAAEANAEPVGAAWCRLLSDPQGYGWVADDIPEISIAVTPDAQGRGIGRQLLHALCTLARVQGFTAVSLSVADGNTARHLYEQQGFTEVGRSGGSAVMLKPLSRSGS